MLDACYLDYVVYVATYFLNRGYKWLAKMVPDGLRNGMVWLCIRACGMGSGFFFDVLIDGW